MSRHKISIVCSVCARPWHDGMTCDYARGKADGMSEDTTERRLQIQESRQGGYHDGAANELAKVVAWLRSAATSCRNDLGMLPCSDEAIANAAAYYDMMADALERGEHKS